METNKKKDMVETTIGGEMNLSGGDKYLSTGHREQKPGDVLITYSGETLMCCGP
jgi:hypothetical protein